MNRRAVSTGLLAALLSPAFALAHDFWIEPSTFRPAVGSSVEIHFRVGEGFRGDPVARSQERIVRFVRVSASGASPVPGTDGREPAGIVRITEPGLQIIGYRSNSARVDLPAEKFEQYLKEEGLEHAISHRAAKGETAKPSRERYSRSVKTLLCAAECASGKDRALGFTLELVSEKNPYATKPGDELSFRLFFEGKPLEGVLVMALSKEEPERKLSARSDVGGRVVFLLPQRGVWLVKAVHMTRAPDGGEVDWESVWASLTFELPDGKHAGSGLP